MSQTTNLWLAPVTGLSPPFVVARPSTETVAELCNYISTQEHWPPGATRVFAHGRPDLAPTTRISEIATTQQLPLSYWSEIESPVVGKISMTQEVLDDCLTDIVRSHQTIANFRRFGGLMFYQEFQGRIARAFIPGGYIAQYVLTTRHITIDQFITAALPQLPPAPEQSRVDAALEAMWERALPRFSPAERSTAHDCTIRYPFFIACQLTVLAEGDMTRVAEIERRIRWRPGAGGFLG
jgi:hypothetical protein